MARFKQVSAREAERLAEAARRREAMKRARRGDEEAAEELRQGGERRPARGIFRRR